MGQAQTVAGRSAIVTQARLALAYDLRHERLSQEAIAKKMERAEKALVAEILTEYDAGTPIESGDHCNQKSWCPCRLASGVCLSARRGGGRRR
jgi:hypothetical protein